MLFLLLAAAVVFPTVVSMVAEFRDDMARRRRTIHLRRPADETLALRLLLAAAIDRDEYRRAIRTIAERDEIAHPVRVPHG